MERPGDSPQGDTGQDEVDPEGTEAAAGGPAADAAEPDPTAASDSPPDDIDEPTVVGAPLPTPAPAPTDPEPTDPNAPDAGSAPLTTTPPAGRALTSTAPPASTAPTLTGPLDPPPPTSAPTSTVTTDVPVLDAQNILWHFGALSAAVAGIAVVTRVHDGARGFWILLVSLAFMAVYAAGAAMLLRLGRRVPGGIVAATAVSFVPLVAIAFEQLVGVTHHGVSVSPSSVLGSEDGGGTSSVYGLGPNSSQGGGGFGGHEFAIAVATVVAGLLVYAFVRYAFVFAWVAIATLVAAELLLPAFTAQPSSRDRADVLLVTGFVFLAIGLYSDLVRARRIAFWWYLVGLVAVTSGFSYDIEQHRSPGWLFALAAGAIALVVAVGLHRATWGFFGLLGVWAPIAHYAWHWFGTLGTAFALFVTGFVLLGLGVMIQQVGEAWTGALDRRARRL